MKNFFKGLNVNKQKEVIESVTKGSISLYDASDMISYDLFKCGIWELEDKAKIFICKKLASLINGKYRCNLQ